MAVSERQEKNGYKMATTTHTSLRIDPTIKAAAQRAAKAECRTLTSLVEVLLRDYCAEKGFLHREDNVSPKPNPDLSE
jgi:hypothetical protein